MNKFLILKKNYFKMLSKPSDYEDTEFEDDFEDDSDEPEETED